MMRRIYYKKGMSVKEPEKVDVKPEEPVEGLSIKLDNINLMEGKGIKNTIEEKKDDIFDVKIKNTQKKLKHRNNIKIILN